MGFTSFYPSYGLLERNPKLKAELKKAWHFSIARSPGTLVSRPSDLKFNSRVGRKGNILAGKIGLRLFDKRSMVGPR
jgi:hypothetical protein